MLLRVLWPERILWSIVTGLRSLHWLPISKQIAYKVLSLTSQYLRETAPRYLQEPVSPYTPSRAFSENKQKSTCGFSENTNKKHMWIQWEHKQKKLWIQWKHKQKTPVDSVKTQAKNTCGFSENTNKKTPVDSVKAQTKNTCGFSENRNKKLLWIQWEYKQKAPRCIVVPQCCAHPTEQAAKHCTIHKTLHFVCFLIQYNKYNTIIEHISTPVPTVDNIHIQIYMLMFYIHNRQKGYIHTDIHTGKELDKVLHRTIFAQRVIDCLSHMCVYSKSKITTYALRLTVFCCQNRLITEPVQDKGGQFAADLCIVFIYFVFQHQLLKEAGESWQALVEFAFVYKLLSLKYH